MRMTNWTVIALGLGLGLGAQAALAQGFTVAQAMNYPFPYGLTASAGARVAWVFDIRGARNVWVADGPAFAARQVTHYSGDDGMPIAALQLSPDGRTVVYARGSETNAQGEVADTTSNVSEPQQQVWAADVATGEPRLLGNMNCPSEGCEDIQISPDGAYAAWVGAHQIWLARLDGQQPARPLAYVRGNNSGPQWSPDSQQIAFVSNRGTHALIAIVKLGASTVRYVDPTVFRDTLPRWSRDGGQLAFIRMTGGGGARRGVQPWAMCVWDAASGKTRVIWQSADDANGGYPGGEWESPAFQFAAGGRIVFASQADGWVHLYSIAAAGGVPVLLTPGAGSFKDVALSPDGTTLVYSSNHDDIDRRHLWRVALDHPSPVELTPGTGLEWTPVFTGDGKAVVCLAATATRPAMPYLITPQGRTEIASSALSAAYPSAQFVTPKQVIFRSPDGLEIHGQLFVPREVADHPGTRHPGLIFTHGGPSRQMLLGFHPMDAYNFMYAANEYLASRGYVVLSVNYRLGIMYGRAFREPAHAGAQGASEYQDVVAGAKYLQALPYVAADKIGLWGGSYGGYLTALGLARNSDIFKAGVDYAGVHDWNSIGRGNAAASLAGTQNSVSYQSSPVAAIATWTSPVLLIQADDDRNVPFAQTVEMVHLLRAHHLPYEQIVIPDEVHDSLMWSTWVRVFQATGDFFDRTLVKGETIKPAMPEN